MIEVRSTITSHGIALWQIHVSLCWPAYAQIGKMSFEFHHRKISYCRMSASLRRAFNQVLGKQHLCRVSPKKYLAKSKHCKTDYLPSAGKTALGK